MPAPAPQFALSEHSLGDGDAGGTFCLPLGQTITVVLHAPAPPNWGSTTPSDRSVLAARPNGAFALVRGATAAEFAAVRRGTVTLTSTRDGSVWSARVVVQ